MLFGVNPLSAQELANRNARGLPPRQLAALQGTRHAGFCDRLPCGFLHPGRSCSANVVTFLPQAYWRALPVYAPVYILPAILVHRQELLQVRHHAWCHTMMLGDASVLHHRSRGFIIM